MGGVIITLAQQKGGTGKTTVAAHLAVAFAIGGDAANKYRRFCYASRIPLPAADPPAYVCAMRHLDQASFTACYCGD